MADPAWTDATRDDIANDLGFALGLGSLARSLAFFFHPQNSEFLVDDSDETAAAGFTLWNITACKPGLDTAADGWIYWKYTDGGASGTLQAYRGSARDGSAGNELVATTGSVANSATMTFTAQTGYTLAGTVYHDVLGGSFNWRSQIIVPAKARCEHLFDNTQVDDSQIRSAFLNSGGFIPRMRTAALSMLSAAQDAAALILRTKIRRQLTTVSDTNAINTVTVKRSSFAYTKTAVGLGEDLRAAWTDNTGGSGEVEVDGATLAGAVAYGGPWDGTAVTPTYGQRGVPALITATCDADMTDSSPPRFSLTRAPTDTRRAPGEGTQSESLARPLYVGSNWKAPEWGIESLTVDYLASVANVTSAVISTTASDWSVTGLRSGNSDNGEVFARYVTSDTTLRFYRSEDGADDADETELVAQVTLATNAVNTVFTTDENDSGIVIVGKTGAGSGGLLVDGATGDVNYNVPQSTAPASYFTITITEPTAGGEWQRNLRDGGIGGVSCEPNTGAGDDMVDGQITRCLPMVHAGVRGDRY